MVFFLVIRGDSRPSSFRVWITLALIKPAAHEPKRLTCLTKPISPVISISKCFFNIWCNNLRSLTSRSSNNSKTPPEAPRINSTSSTPNKWIWLKRLAIRRPRTSLPNAELTTLKAATRKMEVKKPLLLFLLMISLSSWCSKREKDWTNPSW